MTTRILLTALLLAIGAVAYLDYAGARMIDLNNQEAAR